VEYDRRWQDRLLFEKIFFFRENGANECRVPVGSRGCRSHSSTNTECACSHGGEVFILRKRDIDRNGGRVLYRLRDSWRGRCSGDAMGSRARNVRTRGSPDANARVMTDFRSWIASYRYVFLHPYNVIGQIIHASILSIERPIIIFFFLYSLKHVFLLEIETYNLGRRDFDTYQISRFFCPRVSLWNFFWSSSFILISNLFVLSHDLSRNLRSRIDLKIVTIVITIQTETRIITYALLEVKDIDRNGGHVLWV